MSDAGERRYRFAGHRVGRVVMQAAMLATVLLLSPQLAAQTQSEFKVKAAYVFNLTKYVEWPAAGNQVGICVVGEGPMAQALGELAGKVSESRRIIVVASPSDADLKRCDLVYITYSSPKKIASVLEKLSGRSVLTVGEVTSFTRLNGMMALLTVGEHIQIEVNLQACQRASLKVSSKLLSLARIVTSSASAG
jgi:hypothetical protein